MHFKNLHVQVGLRSSHCITFSSDLVPSSIAYHLHVEQNSLSFSRSRTVPIRTILPVAMSIRVIQKQSTVRWRPWWVLPLLGLSVSCVSPLSFWVRTSEVRGHWDDDLRSTPRCIRSICEPTRRLWLNWRASYTCTIRHGNLDVDRWVWLHNGTDRSAIG